jgi:hypothetical protein
MLLLVKFSGSDYLAPRAVDTPLTLTMPEGAMTVADCVRFLAELGRWPLADVQQRARYLREAGRLPQGGHGVNAPHIGPGDATTLLIGLAATDAQSRVVDGATLYEALIPVEPRADGVPDGTLGEMLAMLLADPAPADTVHTVHVDRSWPAATISFRDGRVQHYSVDGQLEMGTLRMGVTIHGSVLTQLALDLADDENETSGWGDSPAGAAGAAAFARHAAERRSTT